MSHTCLYGVSIYCLCSYAIIYIHIYLLIYISTYDLSIYHPLAYMSSKLIYHLYLIYHLRTYPFSFTYQLSIYPHDFLIFFLNSTITSLWPTYLFISLSTNHLSTIQQSSVLSYLSTWVSVWIAKTAPLPESIHCVTLDKLFGVFFLLFVFVWLHL